MPGDVRDLCRGLGPWPAGAARPACGPSSTTEIARHFERQLVRLGPIPAIRCKGQDRDLSIDAIEDFVSNHPRGHCEYFATAMALMLRSQGIPSRVVLGYRCDEWDPRARASRSASCTPTPGSRPFSTPDTDPPNLAATSPVRWTYGGWLRLDATPAADLGTHGRQPHHMGRSGRAACTPCSTTGKTTSPTWTAAKQQESVYEPIRRAVAGRSRNGCSDCSWWRELFAGLARLGCHAAKRYHGEAGSAWSLLLVVGGSAGLAAGGWRDWRVWLWRRLFGRGGPRRPKREARSSSTAVSSRSWPG